MRTSCLVKLVVKGCSSFADGAEIAVDAHHLHQVIGKRALLLHRVVAEQEAVVNLIAAGAGFA